MMVSRIAARRAWMPVRIARPAATCATPVAYPQNAWPNGSQLGTSGGGKVHVEKMRAPEQHGADPERQLSHAREACSEPRLDPGIGGVDDQSAGPDRNLRGGAAIGSELGRVRKRDTAVHQENNDQRVVDGQPARAPGRGPAPLDGCASGRA